MAATSKSLLGLEPPEFPKHRPEHNGEGNDGNRNNQPDPRQLSLQLPGDSAGTFDDAAVPHLVIQLRDDLSRSRLREAFWISVVTHLLLLIGLAFLPKLIPMTPVRIATAADLARDREVTYLNLPPDAQRVAAPNTNIISDKNRIATSRAPIYHPPDRILDSSRPGMRSQPSQPAAPAPSPAGGSQTTQAGQPAQQQTAQNTAPALPAAPPEGARNPFAGVRSGPGAVESAATATAPGQGRLTGDLRGELGRGMRSQANRMGPAEVLSDTQGVDFSPYLARLVAVVKRNWYDMIPESARAPFYETGEVVIEFNIRRDGQFEAIQIIASSGRLPMDLAAKASITSTDPFEPLPREWHGDRNGEPFRLRFHYLYNPDKANALK